uniref:killer cell lectin-like receptor subfamily B member 1 n=1 Tax=Jaculus jaculus TaxID=51337 RepID=UPI001E1B39BE|nr:killer cell lectin-like receptor subfamily B member 1 [Jaculus jaculus]
MDTSVVYADLNIPRTSRPKNTSSPALPRGSCAGTCRHQLLVRLGGAALVLLILGVIGFTVSVRFLTQKSSAEQSSVDVQENRTKPTEKPALLKCPEDWHIRQNKCLLFPQASGTWKESLDKCTSKESTLLLIRDREELTDIQNLENIKENLFWIGLSYTSEKVWKWTNNSIFNSDILQIIGVAEQGSCVAISLDKVFSEHCEADNKMICQRDSERV